MSGFLKNIAIVTWGERIGLSSSISNCEPRNNFKWSTELLRTDYVLYRFWNTSSRISVLQIDEMHKMLTSVSSLLRTLLLIKSIQPKMNLTMSKYLEKRKN